MPIKEDESELTLAMVDPTDQFTIDAFAMVTGRTIRPMLALPNEHEAALERIVPAEWSWQHIEEGEENAPTHIRASFMGPSVVIPLRDDGELALGVWQGIFFCEFDGPRERSVCVSVLA